MPNNDRNAYRPTSVSPPGETLADLLEERGISQAEFATCTGRPPKTINEIIAGKTAITAETALQLERALDVPANFWLAREARYQEYRARANQEKTLTEDVGWLKELPLRDMVRFSWVRRAATTLEQVEICLKFFGVASVAAWRERWEKPIAAFRLSTRVSTKEACVAAWLRQGEIAASKVACAPFNKGEFRRELHRIRRLTCVEDPKQFLPVLIDACAKCGVAVVLVQAPKGCPASGATRWVTPHKAVLQLSLRYRTNDHLWFTFFHEAAHLLLHGKKLLFLEGARVKSDFEAEADRFASDTLIPTQHMSRLREVATSKAAVTAFAHELGIAPGIVVGRLQKEELLDWSEFNALKIRYSWADE